MKRKIQNQTNQPIATSSSAADPKKPLGEHLGELRSRLYKCVLSIVFFSGLAYLIEQQLVRMLLKPAKGQQFIYTSPIGGLNFLFQVCLYFGLTLSIPVIIYQLLRFIEPLFQATTSRLISRYSFYSVALAVFGAGFGYLVGLPVALGFLSKQFTTTQIKPLLTIQAYMSFVTLYLLGSALIFQLPLIISFINRIKPLSPRKLFKIERYVLPLAFIAGAILMPTTNILDQLLFVVPIIFMYQLAIGLVFIHNRKARRSAKTHRQPTGQTTSPPAQSEPKLISLRPAVAQLQMAKPVIRPISQPGGRIWDIA